LRKIGLIVRVAESNPQGPVSWKRLFAGASGSGAAALRIEVTVLKKAGQPLLIVPRKGAAAVAALGLYSAQTALARAARSLWRLTLPLGWTAGAERDELLVATEAPFVQFLSSISRRAGSAGTATGESNCIPRFAILAGNPRAPGRRFVVLVFGEKDRPLAVVKTGAEPRAIELIERELGFLNEVKPGTPGIPAVRERFCAGPISAFAMDYIEGESPRPEDAGGVVPLLNSWLHRERSTRIEELLAWRRLAEAAGGDEVYRRLQQRLGSLVLHPAIFHGDFAPWNLKVSRADGSCMVLDWERGEWMGPPGWDWFHYVLQPAILVQRQSGLGLTRTVEALLASPDFRKYASAAGLANAERGWLLAYLLHCRDVLRPAEGSPKVPELLKLLAAKWLST